ncbi:MAG: kinase [bacterium]
MIISRTPLRISFFGGGTDYPAWFSRRGGVVLSTTINKYIYITTRYLPPFFKHRSRIVWSVIEMVKNNSDIVNPAVRECLKFMKIKSGVEVHYDADLPARTGLGSSSTFTVGLLNSLYALEGRIISKMQLAGESIYIEQEMIKDKVGCQDQVASAYGGFNRITFERNGAFAVKPVAISANRLKILNKHLLLVFTGFARTASDVSSRVIRNVEKKRKELAVMQQMVSDAVKILTAKSSSILDFGKLLHENWKIKRSLAEGVSIPTADAIYTAARASGALGGKLLGAGGGGFMLIFASPQAHPAIKKKLKKFLIVPFEFEKTGSRIIFSNPEVKYK